MPRTAYIRACLLLGHCGLNAVLTLAASPLPPARRPAPLQGDMFNMRGQLPEHEVRSLMWQLLSALRWIALVVLRYAHSHTAPATSGVGGMLRASSKQYSLQ